VPLLLFRKDLRELRLGFICNIGVIADANQLSAPRRTNAVRVIT
jgi:hypothetical protein